MSSYAITSSVEGRRPWWSWIVDHNPFYLLSGVAMLSGCYLINFAAHQEEDRVELLLGLLAVFNVYEFLVIGLGLYLLRARAMVRDAAYLLILEVLLLVDVTLLYNEIFTASLGTGFVTAGSLAMLAAVKLALIARFLNLRLTPAAWALVGADFAALFATPAVLRVLTVYGKWELLPSTTFLWMWWGVGLLISAHALPGRWTASGRGKSALGRLRQAVALAVVVAPLLSVLGHLRAAHYVYEHAVEWCHYAPPLLAFTAVAVRRLRETVTPETLQWSSVVAGSVTLLMSLSFPDTLKLGFHAGPDISPLRMALVAVAALWVWTWWLNGGVWLLGAAAASLLTSVFGTTPQNILETLGRVLVHSRDVGRWLLPRSLMGWGVASVAASFLLLVVGAGVSLICRPRPHRK